MMASFRKVEAWALVIGLASLCGLRSAVGRAEVPEGTRSPSLSGQVVRVDGGIPADAEVFATLGFDEDSTSPTWRVSTDATGRFRLDRPDPMTRSDVVSLWVHRRGLGIARLAVATARPASAPALRPVLAPLAAEAAATVRIIGPRGEPAAGVRVRPRLWYEGGQAGDSARQASMPPELAARLEAVTDAEGRAAFPDLAALHLAGVAVATPDADGVQLGEWEPGWDARVRSVRLREVGAVAGRVRGDDDRPRAGWMIRVRTRADGRVAAIATATTDREGRFALKGIATGPLEVHAEPPAAGDEVASRGILHATLAASQLVTIEVHARRGVQAVGRVVDRESGTPIAGAEVALSDPGSPDRRVATDRDGRFEAVLRAAPDRARVGSAPEPYLVPAPRAGDRGRLDPSVSSPGGLILALDRGVMLRGSVALPPESDGEIGLLTVRASWEDQNAEDRARVARSSLVGVAADGTFVVGPIPPGVAVTLRASLGAEGPAGPEVRAVATPGREPSRLGFPDRMPTTLVGRVVGPGEAPIARALVQFRIGTASEAAEARGGHRVTADGLDAVVTDGDGWFRHAIRLGAGSGAGWRWSAAVAGEGDASPAVAGSNGREGEVAFPTIALTREGPATPLDGRVEGTDGRAISGATVRDLAGHRATTDAQGRYRLPRPGRDPEVPPILVAECAGYRCSGALVRDEMARDDRPLVLTLARLDEPTPERRAGPTPGPADGVFELEVGRLLARRDPVVTASLAELLAETHPERAADLLRAGGVVDPRVGDGLRALVARHLAGSRGSEAAEPILEAIEAPEVRAHARLAVIATLAARSSPDRRPPIERVERDARSIEDLRARVEALGEVAGAWLDSGQADRARDVLRDAEAGADSLPKATAGAAAWSGLAPVLARIDPARARARLDGLPDPRLADRGRLAAARALAVAEPAEAIRFVREVRDRRLAVRAIAEVAHRIAPRDPRLARSLVDSIHDRYPVEAAHALGILAHASAPGDHAEAVALLRLAFDRLGASARAGEVAHCPDRLAEPSHVASALLPVVEAIDPGLIPEFLWRAVALHDARPGSGPVEPGRRCSNAALATLLHRYDPALALGVFDPSRLDFAALPAHDLDPLILATARLAPDLAARWVAADAHLPGRDRHLALLVAALAPTRGAQAGQDARRLLHFWAPNPGIDRP